MGGSRVGDTGSGHHTLESHQWLYVALEIAVGTHVEKRMDGWKWMNVKLKRMEVDGWEIRQTDRRGRSVRPSVRPSVKYVDD